MLTAAATQLYRVRSEAELRAERDRLEEQALEAGREARRRDPVRYQEQLQEEAEQEVAAAAQRVADAADRGEPAPEEPALEPEVQREIYQLGEQWLLQEEQLLAKMESLTAEREAAIEPEPAGIDELLVQGGFPIPTASPSADVGGSSSGEAGGADAVLAGVEERVQKVSVRPGYDLVRVGNFDERPDIQPPEIAFFHHRLTLETEFRQSLDRQNLVQQCCGVLRAVAAVYDYPHYFVTLFYQPHSASRFIRQKIMFNLWPIDEHRKANKIADVRQDPFAYMCELAQAIIAHNHYCSS